MIRNAATAMLFGLALMVAGAQAVSAQDVAGALKGRVATTDSSSLATVEVEASSPSLQQAVSVQTDARGNFRLLSLPIGSYTVRFRVLGYRPTRYDGVVVGLGQTTDMGVIPLLPQVVELPEIVVQASLAPIDPTTTTSGTRMEAEEFDALPIDRSFVSVVGLAPQAISQLPSLLPHSDGVNVAGGSVWDNAYFVDGMDVTEPINNANGTNLPYNFLQAVELKTGGYEAEYGRALGGIVNMVTPSGGNSLEGEAFSFFSDHRLRTDPRLGGAESNLNSFTQFDVGLSLSGPIQRDRVWFYAAYNPIFDTRTASYPGMAPAHDRQVQHRFAGKLTWQPWATTRLTLTATGDPSWHNEVTPGNGFFPPSQVLNPDVVLAKLHEGGGSLSLRATQVVHSRWLLEAAVSGSRFHNDEVPQTTLGATAPNYLDGQTATGSGGFGGSDLQTVGRTTLLLSSTLAAGRHTLKGGVQYENTTLTERLDEGQGVVGGYILRINDSTYIWDRLQNHSEVGNRVASIYGQDSWEVSPLLRFNAGLRWEQQYWAGAHDRHAQTIGNEWSPRLGFVVSPRGAGSQKLFGSVGRFYEQVPLGALSLFYGDGFYQVTGYAQDPRVDTTGGQPAFGGTFGGVKPVHGLRGEYQDEVTLGYERMLSHAWKVIVEGTYRVLRSVIEDTQAPDGTEIVGNPSRGSMALFPAPDHGYRALEFSLERVGPGRLHLRMSYVLSRNSGNYLGLFAGDGQFANASTQFDNKGGLIISKGPLPNDRTHVVKLLGSYRTGVGLTVGGYGFWQSGTPLSKLGFDGGNPLFLSPRGTAGRTPSLWDLNLRLEYQLPGVSLRGAGSRVILDLTHVGSPRKPVVLDQLRFASIDSLGQPSDPNPRYGQPLQYQPPMSVRLGVVVGF